MKRFIQIDLIFVIILLILSAFYLWGTRYIPFHPDESTQLYMSSDFEALFANPTSLSWQIEKVDDSRQRYRLLDAPITKYLLGLGRVVAGRDALAVDWDWAASWDDNISAGAYPDPQLFQIGRRTITLLLPLSLVFIYLIGLELQGRTTGILAALLFGTHAVVLLHGRRAMAEGTLLLGVLFATWSILKARRYPWLAGLGLGFAFNAKQSAIALMPVAVFALLWLPKSTHQRLRKAITNFLQFILVFAALTLALNPVFWHQPILAAQAAISARQDLIERQVEDTLTIAPEKLLESPLERALVLIANIYISPPEYGLVGNLSPTRESVDAYIAIPGHNLFRGVLPGAIFLILTILGLYMAMRDIITTHHPKHYTILVLFLTTLFLATALILAVPFPWARYSIPTVPFACIWLAYGIYKLLNGLQRALLKKNE